MRSRQTRLQTDTDRAHGVRFLSWDTAGSHPAHGPLLLRPGTLQVNRALAVIHTNHPTMCSGLDTHFGSLGTRPVALIPRYGGWVQNLLSDLPQVSNCLYFLHIHSIGIKDLERANLGPFYVVFDHPLGGGQNTKIAIVFERGARLFRPCKRLFMHTF